MDYLETLYFKSACGIRSWEPEHVAKITDKALNCSKVTEMSLDPFQGIEDEISELFAFIQKAAEIFVIIVLFILFIIALSWIWRGYRTANAACGDCKGKRSNQPTQV